MTDCALDLCTGDGVLVITDFTGTFVERCACRVGQEMPAEVAERLALVVDGEAHARRRAQELMNQSYNQELRRSDGHG